MWPISTNNRASRPVSDTSVPSVKKNKFGRSPVEWPGYGTNGTGSNTGKGRDFAAILIFQTISGVHSASTSMGTGSPLRGKLAGV